MEITIIEIMERDIRVGSNITQVNRTISLQGMETTTLLLNIIMVEIKTAGTSMPLNYQLSKDL